MPSRVLGLRHWLSAARLPKISAVKPSEVRCGTVQKWRQDSACASARNTVAPTSANHVVRASATCLEQRINR